MTTDKRLQDGMRANTQKGSQPGPDAAGRHAAIDAQAMIKAAKQLPGRDESGARNPATMTITSHMRKFVAMMLSALKARKMYEWLLAVVLASLICHAVLVKSARDDYLAAGEAALHIIKTAPNDIRDGIAEIWRVSEEQLKRLDVRGVLKITFAALMFGFAIRESAHIAKQAWRAFSRSRQAARSTHGVIRPGDFTKKMSLALTLILCAGPVGYYGLQLVPSLSMHA